MKRIAQANPAQEAKAPHVARDTRPSHTSNADSSRLLVSGHQAATPNEPPPDDGRDANVPITLNRFQHDFSRIPVHTPAPILMSMDRSMFTGRQQDRCEVEAENVAKAVVHSPAPQAIDTNQAVRTTRSTLLPILPSPGEPLDSATRAFMEPRFGRDFGNVRVHVDADADSMARHLHARAFTSGRDIVFRQGRYAPATDSGKTLLAHELVHTIQQERLPDRFAIQRQSDDDPEMHAEPDAKEPDILAEDEDEDEEREHDEPEGKALSGKRRTKGPGDTPKPGKAVRRRHNQRSRFFAGLLTNIFGGMRGKYFKNWVWSWGKVKTERGPSSQKTREQVLRASDADSVREGDSLITAHGAAFYQGEPIAGTVPLPNFEGQASVAVATPTVTLAPNEVASAPAVTKTVTGTLEYSFGDAGDPASGPQAQIIVERFDGVAGWTVIHDTKWLTTRGKTKVDVLDAKLTTDAVYRVRVFAQYWNLTGSGEYQWGDGRTQVDYVLKIQEQVTAKVIITKTKAGKSRVTKGAHKIRLKL